MYLFLFSLHSNSFISTLRMLVPLASSVVSPESCSAIIWQTVFCQGFHLWRSRQKFLVTHCLQTPCCNLFSRMHLHNCCVVLHDCVWFHKDDNRTVVSSSFLSFCSFLLSSMIGWLKTILGHISLESLATRNKRLGQESRRMLWMQKCHFGLFCHHLDVNLGCHGVLP